jgi:hypothetical protein
MSYKVKNWGKFQHFKDRRPPWIKLYRDLLDDLEWFELDATSSKHLINLWLIASEFEGKLPSVEVLCFRLRLKKQEVTSILSKLSHWLEQDDISMISEVYQDDSTETETETEKNVSKGIIFNSKNNCFENIDEVQKILWKEAFPAVNFDIELTKAVLWLKDNPTKKKSNYARFLSSWFSRCQDSGGTKTNVKTQDKVSFI